VDMGESSGARVLTWTHGTTARTGIRSVGGLTEFQAIYEECLPIVLRYMLARVHDPAVAEDLTGDVFERAVRSWSSFEYRSAPKTWILGIAHHVISHHWRGARKQPLRLDAVSPSQLRSRVEVTLEEEVQNRAREEVLQAALSRMSNDDQELLALRYAGALSFREIAEVLSVREVTVRVRMHRTLARLRVTLTELEDSDT
jgi:RNA polymerase sigma factor (sigma-70 family)